MHLVDVAIGVIKVHETGRWAHINVKLLHLFLVFFQCIQNKISKDSSLNRRYNRYWRERICRLWSELIRLLIILSLQLLGQFTVVRLMKWHYRLQVGSKTRWKVDYCLQSWADRGYLEDFPLVIEYWFLQGKKWHLSLSQYKIINNKHRLLLEGPISRFRKTSFGKCTETLRMLYRVFFLSIHVWLVTLFYQRVSKIGNAYIKMFKSLLQHLSVVYFICNVLDDNG